jgi:hypothetical protein
MLYKETLDRHVVLHPRDFDQIDEDLLLRKSRDQLCGRLDRQTQKELIWIVGIDYAHFEAHPEGTVNSDGTTTVELKCLCVLRRLNSGEELVGVLYRKGDAEGGRPIVMVENIPMAIDEDSGYDDTNVGDKIRVKVHHANYNALSIDPEGGRNRTVTARGAFE